MFSDNKINIFLYLMKVGLEKIIGVLVIKNYLWFKLLGCFVFFIIIIEIRDGEINLLLYRFGEGSLGSDFIDFWIY